MTDSATDPSVCLLAVSTGPAEMLHYRNEVVQRSTFGKTIPTPSRMIFVRGNPRLVEPSFDVSASVLEVPVEGTSENILMKSLLGVRWVLENIKSDFIVRTNTTSYFHIPSLIAQAKELPDSGCYAGKVGYYEGATYVSGSGTWMSRDVAEMAGDLDVVLFRQYLDDVALGMFMKSRKVVPLALDRNDVGDFQLPRPHYHSRCKGMTSLRSDELMPFLHSIYISETDYQLDSAVEAYLRFQHRQMLRQRRPRRYLEMLRNFEAKATCVVNDFATHLSL